MKKIVLAASILVTLAGGTSYAAHPLCTEDTGTVEKGKFQLELTGEVGRVRLPGGRAVGSEIGLAFTAGIAEKADVSISLPYQLVTESGAGHFSDQGFGDGELASKIRLLENGPFSLAVRPAISLPIGDESDGFGTGRVSYGASVIASTEFKPFAVHAVLGYTHNNEKDARKDIYSASLAGTAEVADGVTVVAEVAAESNGERGNGTWPAFATAGVIWGVSDSIDLDLGIKTGLNRAEVDVAGLAGIVFKF